MGITFVMLKPDAVQRGLGYDIMQYFKKTVFPSSALTFRLRRKIRLEGTMKK